jgi:hypothetical protein
MQNGFRRIALAQGLLPERLASGEVAPSDTRNSAAAETGQRLGGGRQGSDTVTALEAIGLRTPLYAHHDQTIASWPFASWSVD